MSHRLSCLVPWLLTFELEGFMFDKNSTWSLIPMSANTEKVRSKLNWLFEYLLFLTNCRIQFFWPQAIWLGSNQLYVYVCQPISSVKRLKKEFKQDFSSEINSFKSQFESWIIQLGFNPSLTPNQNLPVKIWICRLQENCKCYNFSLQNYKWLWILVAESINNSSAIGVLSDISDRRPQVLFLRLLASK